jgi:hypothetical protein
MSERRTAGSTNRQCARSGCNAIAVATFTFDASARTVWLDTPLDGNARAGELCARHARSLTPPRGWQIEDRRPGRVRVTPRTEPTSSAANAAPVEQPRVSTPVTRRVAPQAARGPAPQLAVSGVRVELEDELRGLLDAHSPLLARAFRSSGPV